MKLDPFKVAYDYLREHPPGTHGGITSSDTAASYFLQEIMLLRNRTEEELREIHKVKLVFPGCRVIQEGPEASVKNHGGVT